MPGISCYGPPPKTSRSKNARVSGKSAFARSAPTPPSSGSAAETSSDASTAATSDSSRTDSTAAAAGAAKWVVAADMGKFSKGQEVKLNGNEVMHGKHAIHVLPNGEKLFLEQLVPGKVRMLIVALDYYRSEHPLACSTDAQNMLGLAKQCGVQDVTVLLNEKCTKDVVLAAIKEVGARCSDDDYFVFYFAGRGNGCNDRAFEEEGLEEGFQLLNRGAEELLTDSEFSGAVTSALPKEVRAILLLDCCAAGTVTDMSRERWRGRQAVAITGCFNADTCMDRSRHGFLAHSLLLALDKLGNHDQRECAVGMVYNAILEENEAVFSTHHDMIIESAPDLQLDTVAWPMVPPKDYEAPFTKLAAAGGELQSIGVKDAFCACTCNSETASLRKLGISSSQMSKASPSESAKRSGDEYLARVQGKDLSKQACIVQ